MNDQTQNKIAAALGDFPPAVGSTNEQTRSIDERLSDGGIDRAGKTALGGAGVEDPNTTLGDMAGSLSPEEISDATGLSPAGAERAVNEFGNQSTIADKLNGEV